EPDEEREERKDQDVAIQAMDAESTTLRPQPGRFDPGRVGRRNSERCESDTSDAEAHVKSASPDSNEPRLHHEQYDPERQGHPMQVQPQRQRRNVEPRA